MCLAVPGQIEDLRQNDQATVRMQGNTVEVCTTLVAPVEPGEWVLVHAGYAITKIDAQQAAETWALLDEMTGRASDVAGNP
ncbi:MAG TPA: HypC/HybG/HupF family hydrogenase formation chaperone [Phycisphaerae bacterium]|nr:HypC/HybG/HupF family hydrogenase formation chaperone [Phycisphaerae bacterium]